MLLLTAMTLSAVAILPAPGDILERPLRLELPIATNGTATNEDNTDFNDIPDHELVEAATPEDDIPTDATPQWQDYRVRNGENLTTIFNNTGLSTTTLYKVLDADTKNNLARLKPGQTIELLIDQDNILQQMKIRLNIKQTLIPSAPTTPTALTCSMKRWSGRRRGMTGSSTAALRQCPQCGDPGQPHPEDCQPVPMAAQLRQGSKKGRQVQGAGAPGRQSRARAPAIPNCWGWKCSARWPERVCLVVRRWQLLRWRGNSTERGFRRYPTHSRYRVSSSFNPNRRHPITGRVRPHEGTDFALPVGTPVMATGDGVVLKATSHPLAGTYVVIKHGRTLMTRYLHLSKLLVKPGQKVKMGDKIALSGNTGRSTGAHLHYEVRINNRPVDAMKVKLPMAEPLSGKEKRQFLAKVKSYRKEMEAG